MFVREWALEAFRSLVVASLALAIVLCGVSRALAAAVTDSPEIGGAGELITTEQIGQHARAAMQTVLDGLGLSEPITIQHDVTLYRLRYWTTNFDGSTVVASGLVALPDGKKAKSVVSYFHGTSAQRNTAPSQTNSDEGMEMAALVAGTGHILLAPDYLGLGESHGIHPYMHVKTTVDTCVDFLIASQGLLKQIHQDWPPLLFLMGFSQGGHSTLAVQRELEKLGDPRFTVKASASVAGAFQLRDISLPQALTGETPSHVFYLAYMTNAYAAIYRQPITSVLGKPFAETVPVLFDGNHEIDEIVAGLPARPRDLFTPEFLAAYDNGTKHWLLDAISENDVKDWTPRAPVRLFYGENDVDVLPEEARRAVLAMKSRGADITALSVGPYDHNESILYALPIVMRWFSELEGE
jgi:pimeloyl-ACP methyl ester carboxylesterase